jgi:purine nucleoside phosphorylase
MLGADTVGMSTAIELLHASTRGMRTVICSMVTNTLTDTAIVAVHHDDVLHAANDAVRTMSRVVTEAVGAHADLFLSS